MDIPIVINQNLYTSLGIVNGKEPIGVYVVIGESAKVYSVGHNVWIVDSPPKCLLVQIQDPKFTPMQGLPEGVLPISPPSFGVQVPIPSMTSNQQKRISIRRRQLPCCAGFAITDYRSQGRTFNDKIAGHRAYSAV